MPLPVSPLVWLSSRRDLGWRRRRLIIAVGATTLVFAITLLLSGFRDGFGVEAARTVRALHGDAFVVKEGVAGPFTTLAQLPENGAEAVAADGYAAGAAPFVSIRHTIDSAPVTDVYVVGARPADLGAPKVTHGRAPLTPGEAVLDVAAHRHIGDRVRVAGQWFRVVGLVRDVTVWAGVPAMFVTLPDAQQIVFAGSPSATAYLTRGVPRAVPPGLRVVTAARAQDDLVRPVANAITTIDLLRLFLWLVAAGIVGSVMYISALERSRDFAVFKAFGTDTADLVGTLVVEALVLSVTSAVAAVFVSRLLAKLFPAVIVFPARSVLLVPLVAVVVGVAGSLAGARRAIAVDPALAFAGP